MKKCLLLIVAGLLLCFSAQAQRQVPFQIGAFYQSGTIQNLDSPRPFPQLGLSFGASFEPFYPWPIYLETGISGAMDISFKDGAYAYRMEVPLNLVIQWEPSPYFSVGPYAGVNGALNFKVDGLKNFFTWGVQAGLSIRPGAFIINVAYHRDFTPFIDTAAGLSGIRVAAAFCF